MVHFKGMFPDKIEAHVYNMNDMNTAIKVARELVQILKAEIWSQTVALTDLLPSWSY